MKTGSSRILDPIVSVLGRRNAFVLLVGAMLAIAVGHPYVLAELAGFYFGLPIWIWVQLVVVFFLLCLAWLVAELVSDRRYSGA